MAKTAKKRTARSGKPPASRQKRSGRKSDLSAGAMARSTTKQARAIEMLRSKNGASILALMEVTGWQQHSVRGFLAGVVRKRLKLNLVSEIDAGVRTYRVAGEPAAPSSKVQGAQPKSS
jgi:hypothetical protein